MKAEEAGSVSEWTDDCHDLVFFRPYGTAWRHHGARLLLAFAESAIVIRYGLFITRSNRRGFRGSDLS
jgi:hypothetical protein